MRLDFLIDEQMVTVEANAAGAGPSVQVAGRPVPLELVAGRPGELTLRIGGRRRRLYVAAEGDRRQVFLDGRVWSLRLPEEEDAGADAAAGGPEVFALMPGKVVKVLVAEGDTVREGQPLLIVESMKMESEILAPLGGRVATVKAREGRTIGMGESLLLIEPAAPLTESSSP